MLRLLDPTGEALDGLRTQEKLLLARLAWSTGKNRVVGNQTLRNDVLGHEDTSANALNTAVSRLRGRLKSHGLDIQTERGRGRKLVSMTAELAQLVDVHALRVLAQNAPETRDHHAILELVRGRLLDGVPDLVDTWLHRARDELVELVANSYAAITALSSDAARGAVSSFLDEPDGSLLDVATAASKSPRGSGANIDESVAERFFSEGYVDNSDHFKLAMRDARSVLMLGFSHSRMVSNYKRDLIGLLARGGALRVLAMDPACDAVIDADARSSAPKGSQRAARHQYEAAIAEFVSIRETSPDAGTFELRLIDRMPPYTIYLFNEDDRHAELYVWLTPWRVPSSQRPGFRLSSGSDERWFRFFADQVRVMWDSFPRLVEVGSAESGQ